MKIHRLKAALSKAQAEVAKTEKTAKAAVALATSLKTNVREAKRAFKESRRTYKQVRRFFRTASREQKAAEKALRRAAGRLEKLQAKSKKRVKEKQAAPAKKAGPTRSAAKATVKPGPKLIVEQPKSSVIATAMPAAEQRATA